MSINGYKLNCKITRTPHKVIHNFKVVNLPETVDLRDKCGRVYDQGQLGSCTANAMASAYIFDDPSANPSRLQLYYKERSADGDINDDAGSTVTQAVAQAKTGICREELWPYDISKFTVKPSSECDEDAKLHQVVDASQVEQSADSMKGCLASGFPFVLGFAVFPSFENATDGHIPMPGADEQSIGGHCILATGYTKTHWIFKNSWSDTWGDRGYGYIPLQYFLNTTLTSDLWKITKVSAPTVEETKNEDVKVELPEAPVMKERLSVFEITVPLQVLNATISETSIPTIPEVLANVEITSETSITTNPETSTITASETLTVTASTGYLEYLLSWFW